MIIIINLLRNFLRLVLNELASLSKMHKKRLNDLISKAPILLWHAFGDR